MSILHSIILGIVQGLTELLPVSSSAHLFLIPWFFDWTITESFDVALHFGTLLAIGLFFFKDWIALLQGAFKYVIKKEKNNEGKMFFYLVLATIPGGIIGFVLDKYAEEYLNVPTIIALALIIMGIVLYLVDKKSKSITKYNEMNLKQTFFIGLSQALAFIPGVSRSGITMVTARSMGIERESAAKFSFMLSAPIVLAATLYKFKDFVFDISFIIGVLSSFVVGILVIKFLLNYLKNSSFKIFAVYRIIIGVIALMAIYLIK